MFWGSDRSGNTATISKKSIPGKTAVGKSHRFVSRLTGEESHSDGNGVECQEKHKGK